MITYKSLLNTRIGYFISPKPLFVTSGVTHDGDLSRETQMWTEFPLPRILEQITLLESSPSTLYKSLSDSGTLCLLSPLNRRPFLSLLKMPLKEEKIGAKFTSYFGTVQWKETCNSQQKYDLGERNL